MVTDEEKELALLYDPFEGDMGGPDDLMLRDKFVKTRSVHVCHICDFVIPIKSICRSTTWKFDGELMSYWYCPDCCKAMALSMSDDCDDEPILNRYYLRK
jgi:hypothetical protein